MSNLAVERALIILKQMAFSEDGVSVRDLARQQGYSPAVVYKIMQSLVSQEFAQQDSKTQLYYLGPAALQVGLAELAKMETRKVARPHLQSLAEETGETALLGIRNGDGVIYIDKVLSHSEVKSDPAIGAYRPLNCTAVGKAVLAFLSDDEIDHLTQKDAFVKSTPNSIIDLDKLKGEIAQIREQGFSVDREEFLMGAMCVGAPVRDYERNTVAAIAVAGPAQRIKENLEELTERVRSFSKKISASLGYQETK